MATSVQDTSVTKGDVVDRDHESPAYEPPKVKSLAQGELLSAVKKGSKFPARGFSG